MIFSYFSSVASSGAICRKSDFTRLVNLPNVAELVKRFREGDADAKKHLPAFCFHASFRNGGHRSSADALPSGLFMVDFDHLTAEELKKLIDAAVPAEDAREISEILLIHITPSGHGLRLVAKCTHAGDYAKCESLADYQHVLAEKLHMTEKLDEVTTDFARLSFVPQACDVIYLNDRLFNEPPEVTEFKQATAAQQRAFVMPAAAPGLFPDSRQDSYEGIPLMEIFTEYLEVTGGMPEEGARNSRLYTAARDLRYICDFNPRVVASHFPDVGLSAAEVFQLSVSACQSSRGSRIPETVDRCLRTLKAVKNAEEEEDEPEDEPEQQKLDVSLLPSVFRELLSTFPEDFREAGLLALLPICGTLSTRCRAVYLDGETHSPSFFTVISAEQASGKSFARRLVKLLLSSIAEDDAKERAVEQKYHDELKSKKNAKQQPEQPRTKVRLVPASISIAKLLQRLDYADGDHLFTFAEEMDTLIKSNKSGAWSEKNDLYRNAFDNAVYGQDFMSENSYSAQLSVYYNLLVLGTPRQTDRFFSDVENGMVSRTCFGMLPDNFGCRMPQFGALTPEQKLRIDYTVRRMRNAHGDYDLSFCFDELNQWLERQRIRALEENDRARDIFRKRSAVIGFRAILTFAPIAGIAKSRKNQERLSRLGIIVADICLRNQLFFAGAKLNKLLTESVNQSHVSRLSTSIFDALEDDFSMTEVVAELRKRNMHTRPRSLVYAWSKAGMIDKIDTKNYRKNGTDTGTNQDD